MRKGGSKGCIPVLKQPVARSGWYFKFKRQDLDRCGCQLSVMTTFLLTERDDVSCKRLQKLHPTVSCLAAKGREQMPTPLLQALRPKLNLEGMIPKRLVGRSRTSQIGLLANFPGTSLAFTSMGSNRALHLPPARILY